jgi:nucleoside-diphosphate kinase
MELTLVLIKPDAMNRGLAGEILTRLEARGLRIVGLKLMQVSDELARRHYAEHEGKPFFQGLVSFITSTPIVAAVFEGPEAVTITRRAMGVTNPADADPGTVRGDLGLEVGRNLIHGSDSAESARREVDLFFKPDELHSYRRAIDDWILEEAP